MNNDKRDLLQKNTPNQRRGIISNMHISIFYVPVIKFGNYNTNAHVCFADNSKQFWNTILFNTPTNRPLLSPSVSMANGEIVTYVVQ